MRKVFYIGFYDGDMCSPRRKSESNIAGTVYMRGLIDSLKRIGYPVTVVSMMTVCSAHLRANEALMIGV